MMKKIATIIIIILAGCDNGFTQDISDLFIPSSPGLVLADKAPSSVEKPTVPKAFGASLLNLYQGGAVEVTPYWLTDRPDLTYQKWVNLKTPILETFNLSGATFKTDTSSNLTVGFRSQILRLYSKEQRQKLVDHETAIINILTNLGPDQRIDTQKLKMANAELDKAEKRGLFVVEIAGAVLASSTANSFKGLKSNKSGVWANVRWSPSNTILDFVGVVRYAWSSYDPKLSSRDSAFVDYGMALNYEGKNMNLSFEVVKRRDIASRSSSSRVSLSAVYQLNQYFALVGTVGKNFLEADNIITLFGLNMGISRNKVSASGD